MKLITQEIEKKLATNVGDGNIDKPYLKLFNPVGSGTWLISEYDKETGNMFGLCDLGMGCPELGYVNLQEIQEVKLPFGLKIERDTSWSPDKTLIEYWNESKEVTS